MIIKGIYKRVEPEMVRFTPSPLNIILDVVGILSLACLTISLLVFF